MASVKPLLIICDEPIIHKPKPKRIHKIQNNTPYRKDKSKSRALKPKHLRVNNQQENDTFKIKKIQSQEIKFNLDLISLEEIENDFECFESKSEEIEVQKELLNLLKNESDNSEYGKNIRKCKRPQNPLYENFEMII